MKRLLLLTSVMFFCFSLSIGQIQFGGEPISFNKLNVSEVNFEIMPEVDVDALRAEDELFDGIEAVPFRFGHNHEVNLNPNNSGVWDNLGNGIRVWRLGVKSEGAISINLTFDSFHLPIGAEMFIYNHERTEVLGAFNHKNNQEHGYFSTTLIAGDAVIIEYIEPDKVKFPGDINLSMVTHGYRGPKDFLKSFGSSGSCNLNVVCPEASGWEDQINSVAMMVSGGNGFCTGSLINNTNNDGTPYFLTANHCYSGNPATWVFWFNWQSETCNNPPSSPSHNSLNGATLRSRNAASDFCLLELNSMPPESFGAYWAGWNRTTEASLSETIIGVHHPSGDIKKFSYATGGVTTANYLGNTGSGTSHWRIVWSGGTTTEPGSSGSAIFDSNGRIIGQLHGGYAACGNTQPDWYGKLGVSWTGGGTNATRLSNWLDPNNSGVTVIDGIDPYAPSHTIDAELLAINVPESSYSEPQQITPEVVIRNNGTDNLSSASLSYTINGGSSVNTTWNGNLASGQTAIVTFNPIDIPVGNHVFEATVTVSGDENPDNNSLSKNFSVYDCGASLPVPYTQTFNGADLPDCWIIQTTVSSNTWVATTGYTIGGTTNVAPQTGSHFYYVQWQDATNQDEWLISPAFDLNGIMDAELSFWFNGSYEWSVNQNNCDLDLMVSVNGGAWNAIWNEADHPNFNDDATYQWLNTIIDLSAYEGQSNVKFAFRYTGNDGANFAVDNFVITGVETYLNANFTANPLIAETGQNIVFTDASTGDVTSWSWDFGAGASPATANTQGPHNVTYSTEGYKTISLTVNAEDTETKVDYVLISDDPDPCPAITTYPWNENFNSSTLPECWNIETTVASNTWTNTTGYNIGTQFSITPQSGSNFYYVQWQDVQNQNEWLVTPVFNFSSLSNPEISFWFNGSYEWSVNQNNCDLDLMVSVNGGTWNVVWNETDHPNFNDDATYQWLNAIVDLSAYAGQSNVQFAFRYTGNDGANFAVDNITIDGAVSTNEYTLTINTAGNGSVLVNGNPYTSPVTVDEGTTLSLQANPESGWEFVNWTGAITGNSNPETILMDGNKTVTANFAEIQPDQYTLTVNIIGSGSVNVDGVPYITPLTIDENSTVSLQAIADSNWEFVEWLGDITGVSNPQNIIMNSNKNVTAEFTFSTDMTLVSGDDFVKIFPNPANDYINIESSDIITKIVIHDVLGKTIIIKKPMQDNVNLNVNSLNTGIYFVNIHTEKSSSVHKLQVGN